jgi:hypothetical protein
MPKKSDKIKKLFVDSDLDLPFVTRELVIDEEKDKRGKVLQPRRTGEFTYPNLSVIFCTADKDENPSPDFKIKDAEARERIARFQSWLLVKLNHDEDQLLSLAATLHRTRSRSSAMADLRDVGQVQNVEKFNRSVDRNLDKVDPDIGNKITIRTMLGVGMEPDAIVAAIKVSPALVKEVQATMQ